MPDPELLNHPLYKLFPENWSTRAVGPVLFVFRRPIKILAEEYGYLTVDILNMKHGHDIFIFLEEKQDEDFAYVTCKVQSENGKQHIKECYKIVLNIEEIFSKIEIK
ncbi:hypothetical protein EBU71_13645 [bacterium]|jgi:hypothetical protein|nr:hypothetical protein [Candidatus Elulimicrobium humile]